ncbi:hypothetical protein C475_04691 [Halosimplex carlsbadense 2-9-1]|uniref:Small CPxCG-related zinc finger protein n=1 Tax=Halosimplex carlsbadense 2-9-1 TaxID=797114 RepID=M0D071_9EURY|nr:DUF6276 family protein [Halosimplex carlsbadense]ELZ28906.1 hypothetical protein C475_04691 [Halosimplex carlsbadense 2-9-1]
MTCPDCGAPTLAFAVSEQYRDALPGEHVGAEVCTRCLVLRPVADPPADLPDFTAIGDAVPSNDEAAVPFVLMVGLIPSLATNRSEISELLAAVERAGTDPLLALDRLAEDPTVDAEADLRTRRRQLEQLL